MTGVPRTTRLVHRADEKGKPHIYFSRGPKVLAAFPSCHAGVVPGDVISDRNKRARTWRDERRQP